MNFSQAFDLEQSYILINFPMIPNPVPELDPIPDPLGLPDFEIVLYWIDGTLVYDDGVSLADILPLWLNNEIVSEAGYDQLVDAINDTNWHLNKLFLFYMLQSNEMNDQPD
jgi:hypothetical protein